MEPYTVITHADVSPPGDAPPLQRAGGKTLLMYAPVPLYRVDGEFYLEDQASNGQRLWADNFDNLLVMMPLAEGDPPPAWEPIRNIGPALERIEYHPLPMAYRPDQFLRHLSSTRRRIRDLIDRADYLAFSIGGLFGDWGSVACWEAYRKKRPYAVWTDRVESEVVRRGASEGHWRHRLRSRLYHRPMAWLERALIRRATLGLFHGRQTYEAYAPYCIQPEIVHDIHITKADHISEAELAAKIAGAHEGPIRLAYVGRMDPMKGPLDWIGVLERLAARGVDFHATWLGNGTEEQAVRRRVAKLGLGDRVDLPGFTSERTTVLETLRRAHAFLFCHKTPESPRCLIEALISGCPIVGYDSAFSRDLISVHGGGCLTPLDNVDTLAEAVADLANNRKRLSDMIGMAARDGVPFDGVSVFRHRSDVIKRYL